jgi:hypothetical protein
MVSEESTLKTSVLATILLLFTTSLSGCLSSDEKSGFQWPERLDVECETSANSDLDCQLYIEGFEIPVLSAKHPLLNELWIVDLSGVISAWDGESLREVANLSDVVCRCENEQGLFGLAFDEDFAQTGAVLLSYIENGTCDGPNQSSLILADAIVENGTLNASSIQVLREIEQPYRNHNGGHILHIGNNQYLWGVGDGGSAMDPMGHGQNTSTPLGAIHLMQYSNGSVRTVLENSDSDTFILHHGLRNPWRFDVDSQNRLWIADVGQYCYEEINVVPLMNASNFGWAIREGFHDFDENRGCFEEITPTPDGMVDPVIEYGHQNGNCSVTGGFWMDWGPESLRGGYLYGDFCSGSIWIAKNTNGVWTPQYITNVGTLIVGFGQGLDDELLIFSWSGAVYQIS